MVVFAHPGSSLCSFFFSLVRQVLLSFNVLLGDSFSRRSLGIKL